MLSFFSTVCEMYLPKYTHSTRRSLNSIVLRISLMTSCIHVHSKYNQEIDLTAMYLKMYIHVYYIYNGYCFVYFIEILDLL